MCPPPTDPIRPVGPVSGDVFVERTELPGRVQRRNRHEDETDEQRRKRREQHLFATGVLLTDAELDVDAGTYDDHGRPTHRDDEDPPTRRHVNAVA